MLAVLAAAGAVRAQQPPASDAQGTGQPPAVGYPEPAPAPPAQNPQPAPAAAAPAQAPPPAAQTQPPPPASSREPPPGGYGYAYEEPPPPPPPKEPGKIPGFAVRVDPFNAILAGRMGLELEIQLYKFITAELVPIFVVWQKPPLFNWIERDTDVHQESTGLGPISGASIGIGFWLEGKPFRGYVLRGVLTDYGYKYVAKDELGVIDHANMVERRLFASFGSYSKFGVFTIGGEIGIGAELNRRRRCFDPYGAGLAVEGSPTPAVPSTNCKDEAQLQIQRASLPNNPFPVADLRGFPYPVVLEGRISLGFVFEL